MNDVGIAKLDHPHDHRLLRTASGTVLALAACKLLVHLYAGRHYGYFVDELYYLACSRHMDWGYVDQPPLIAIIAWIERMILGDTLPAIRFLPALAGAGEVVIAALMACELGGKGFAQAFAALAVLVAPGVLVADNLLSMNAFEPLFWMGCAWLFIRIVKTGNPKLWLWFGILAGLGLENKYSMLIFGAGIVVGLLLSPQRRLLASSWLWIGARLRSSSSYRICSGISAITFPFSSYWPISVTAGAMFVLGLCSSSVRRF